MNNPPTTTQQIIHKLEGELADVSQEERSARIQIVKECIAKAEEFREMYPLATEKANRAKRNAYLDGMSISMILVILIGLLVFPNHYSLVGALSILMGWLPGFLVVNFKFRKQSTL